MEEAKCRRGRLRRVPERIVSDTWAYRAQRNRQPKSLYQAGTKAVVKRPWRGRKDR